MKETLEIRLTATLEPQILVACVTPKSVWFSRFLISSFPCWLDSASRDSQLKLLGPKSRNTEETCKSEPFEVSLVKN